MKKVAILLFGDYREFETASACYEVFQDFDVDYFVSTWDQTASYNQDLDLNIEIISKERINKFLPSDAVFTSILDESKFDYLDWTQKMVKHWKVLADALRDSDQEYDIVCLLRIEFYIDQFNCNLFIEEGNDNKLHIDSQGLEKADGYYLIGDRYHIGSPELILKYIDLIPTSTKLASHTDFGSLVRWSSIPIEKVRSFSGGLLRPTVSKLLTNNHKSNIETLKRNSANIYILYELFSRWHHNYQNKITFKDHINNLIDGQGN